MIQHLVPRLVVHHVVDRLVVHHVVHRLVVTAYASEMRVIAQSIILVSPMILTGALEQQAQFIIAL